MEVMLEYIGIVVGETSTDKFSFTFSPTKKKRLKNAFVVVETKGIEVIGRVLDITTDNPLLSPENLKFFLDNQIGNEVGDFLKSTRFINYIARCEVLGKFNKDSGTVEPLSEPIETGSKVYFIDKCRLEKLFFLNTPFNLFPGYIEQVKGARFSLNGDDLLTMHCGIFGMTGMGKTTTTGTLLEELTIRGAKSLVFDPHGDYRNLGELREEFYSALKEELLNKDSSLYRLVVKFKKFLKRKWKEKLEYMESKNFPFYSLVREEMRREVADSSIILRMALLFSLLKGEVVESSSPQAFRAQILSFCKEFSFEKLFSLVPEDILSSLMKVVIEGFPLISLNGFFDKYFVLNMIKAFSGEEVSEAQEGYYLKWLEEIEDESFSGDIVDYLLNKVEKLNSKTSSKPAIKRQLEKTKRTIEELSCRNLIPLDSQFLVNEFSSKNGALSFVSNIVFDLSQVSPSTVQRALLYSIGYSAFHLHKSKRLSYHNGDSSILFIIEEARSLIPRSGSEDFEHPASKFARNIIRNIATEGRKMALGLVIISQRPSSVDPLPVSQCNTLILHRVINPEDLSFVKTVGESISEEDISNLKQVERGVSIVTGTALKLRKSLLVKFRNRLSKEGREQPKPLNRIWGKSK